MNGAMTGMRRAGQVPPDGCVSCTGKAALLAMPEEILERKNR